MTQVRAFFGLKNGQDAKGLAAEVAALSMDARMEIAALLRQAGYPVRPDSLKAYQGAA